MSFLKENKFFILLIYINILFILTMAKICYKIENFDYMYVSLLILCGVLFCWFFLTVLRTKTLKTAFVLLLLIGGAVYYSKNTDYVISLIKLYIIDNFNLINSLVGEAKPTDFAIYKPIFIVVLPLLVFFTTLFTAKGAVNTILTVILAMMITLWYLGYTEEIKRYLFHYVFITLITYCINTFIRKMKKLSKSGIKIGIKSSSIVVYTMVISLIIAGITNILPQSYNGLWGTEIQGRFYNKFGNTVENGEEKGKKYKYDIAYSGYGNSSGKLGGPITVNKLIAFRVESDKTYYLRGAVKDYYDGFSWTQTEKKYNLRANPEDPMPAISFSNTYLGDGKVITIHPEELNSSTIFAPPFSNNVSVVKDYVYYDAEATFISSAMLENPYLVYFNDLNNRGNLIMKGEAPSRMREVDAAYYNDYYKKYLQVPDNISTRVYDLVYSLTQNKKNNLQKVQAIKQYLNTKYPYTVSVSQIPEGQEFLDYFLFTEQKGYCTYFATAETIMCRIAGIPTRYVEGFNMSEEKDESGLYIVRNENAHAWTEALLMESPNQGLWYTVDAVPGAVEAIHKEEEQAKAELEKTPIEEKTPEESQPNKPVEEIKEVEGGGALGFTLPPKVIKLLYFILAAAAVNLFVLLIFINKKEKMIRSKSIIPLYKYSLERLALIGYEQSEFIPDMEFIGRMKSEIADKVKDAAELAYREYYGGKTPLEFSKNEYYKFIETQIRMRQSPLEYFIKKYYFYRKISLTKDKIMLSYKKIKTK